MSLLNRALPSLLDSVLGGRFGGGLRSRSAWLSRPASQGTASGSSRWSGAWRSGGLLSGPLPPALTADGGAGATAEGPGPAPIGSLPAGPAGAGPAWTDPQLGALQEMTQPTGETAPCACPACCLRVRDPIIHASGARAAEPAEAAPAGGGGPAALIAAATFAPLDLADTFLLHSNPTATKRIFLDFDGYSMPSSQWENSAALELAAAYSSIDDIARAQIQRVWKTIVEDFAPFEVNVTTQDPGSARLSNSGGLDMEWGIRVVFTQNVNLLTGNKILNTSSNSGGQAYLNSFTWNRDEPALVFNLADDYEMSETASHEVGHTLGLKHDGTGTQEYYPGHGSGISSWGTLMGAAILGFDEPVTTWSRGEYRGANNLEDDLTIITTGKGFGYRADDHGNSAASATPLSGTSFRSFGIIERSDDTDWFAFDTGAGAVSLSIVHASRAWVASGPLDSETLTYSDKIQAPGRPNLKIAASLYDTQGLLVATSQPPTDLAASLELNLAAGRYFLAIDGVGLGDPLASTPSGWSDYGSLGQYLLTGLVQEPGGLLVVSAMPRITSEAGASVSLDVSLARAPQAEVRIAISSDRPTEGLPAPTLLTFNTDNWSQAQTVTVSGVDDVIEDGRQDYSILLDASASSDPWFAALPVKAIAFSNDDDDGPELSFGAAPPTALEGVDSSVSFTLGLSRASTQTVSVELQSVDGSAVAGADFVGFNQTVVFAPGDTSKTVTVTLLNDSLIEAADETFALRIGALSNARLNGPDAVTATLTDTLTSTTTTTLPSGVEVLQLLGTDAIDGSGNAGPNLIIGNAAANRLRGGGGLDELRGGGGPDQFDLSGISQAAHALTITDWSADDALLLSDSLTSRVGSTSVKVRTISTLLSSNKLVLETGTDIRVGSKPNTGFDLFLVNPPMLEADVDLAKASNGLQLFDGLNAAAGSVKLTTTTSGGRGYIGAYDNDRFYLYAFNAGGDKTVTANECQLIATLSAPGGIAPGALNAAAFGWA